MRIIVCIKQIHQVFGKTGRDESTHFVTENDEIRCINPFDIAALELALEIKDAGEGVEVFLLCLGPVIAETDLRRCLAMGADEIYQIDTDTELDGWSKALLLADGAAELKADLVLCGEKSMDSGSGQTGPFMAGHLGLPFVSRVIDITAAGKTLPVRAERNYGKGQREVVECTLPAVFSAALGPKVPRYPSLENKRRISQQRILKLSTGRKMPAGRVTSTRVFSARPRPKHVDAPDSSLPAGQRIEQLLQGSNVQKQGEMVKGSPELQVEKILSLLQEKDFLPRAENEN